MINVKHKGCEMKATLSYDLPADQEELRYALKGSALASAVYDFLELDLRSAIKYGQNEVEIAHAEKWRDKLLERLKDADVQQLV